MVAVWQEHLPLMIKRNHLGQMIWRAMTRTINIEISVVSNYSWDKIAYYIQYTVVVRCNGLFFIFS